MLIVQIVDVGKDPDVPDSTQEIGYPGRPIPKGHPRFITTLSGQRIENQVIYPGQHTEFVMSRVQPAQNGDVVPLNITTTEYEALSNKRAYIAVFGPSVIT